MIWLQIGLTAFLGIIAYFVKTKFNGYDKDHEHHYEHANDLSMHDIDRERDAKKLQITDINNNLVRHIEQDDKRFERLEDKIDVVGEDVKSLLTSVARIEGGTNHGRQRN